MDIFKEAFAITSVSWFCFLILGHDKSHANCFTETAIMSPKCEIRMYLLLDRSLSTGIILPISHFESDPLYRTH